MNPYADIPALVSFPCPAILLFFTSSALDPQPSSLLRASCSLYSTSRCVVGSCLLFYALLLCQ